MTEHQKKVAALLWNVNHMKLGLFLANTPEGSMRPFRDDLDRTLARDHPIKNAPLYSIKGGRLWLKSEEVT